MSAKTKWFYCGKCGFKNHPRPQIAPSYLPHPTVAGAFVLAEGDTVCEQCGTSRDHDAAIDYNPQGA